MADSGTKTFKESHNFKKVGTLHDTFHELDFGIGLDAKVDAWSQENQDKTIVSVVNTVFTVPAPPEGVAVNMYRCILWRSAEK